VRQKQLIGQFLGESFMVSLIAVLLSVAVIQLVLPSFNQFTGKALTFNPFYEPLLVGGLIGIVIIAGFISGIYPALFLSSFNPVTTLKGGSVRPREFGAPAGAGDGAVQHLHHLLTGTVVVWNQLNFMRNAELGFEKEHVVVMQSQLTAAIWEYDNLKQALLEHSSVLSVTGSETVIGTKYQVDEYVPVGTGNPGGAGISYHYGALRLCGNLRAWASCRPRILRGVRHRSVRRGDGEPHTGRTARAGRRKQALGQVFRKNSNEQMVIGVFENFNYTGLQEPIAPMILDMPDEDLMVAQYIKYISARITPGNPGAALTHIEQVWNRFDPTRPIEYFMLDQELASQYEEEEMIGTIAGMFAMFCIVVACLGLLGLASYTTQMRRKDIGVRKVMGASVINIVNVLSFEYLKLVLFSVLIAWPVSWFARR
jgi:putative ABC transport system permease protein